MRARHVSQIRSSVSPAQTAQRREAGVSAAVRAAASFGVSVAATAVDAGTIRTGQGARRATASATLLPEREQEWQDVNEMKSGARRPGELARELFRFPDGRREIGGQHNGVK